MEGFSVRLITTKTEFENIVTKAMLKEEWRVGLYDCECYLIDPTGSFVGEFNGKPIGCVVLTKYGDNFGFIGGYIVCEEYRGKGYGKKIFDTALASLEQSRNVGLIAPLRHEKKYENSGFHGLFNISCFDFHLSTLPSVFLETSVKPPMNICGVDEVDENALFAYDSRVFGYRRNAFLKKWLRAQESHARVAIDDEGSILGYVFARAMIVKEHGYSIGPFFADSESVAEELLKSVFKELLQKSEPPPIVGIDVPQPNSYGIKLAEKFQGTMVYTFIYMTTKGSSNACFDKWYGMTDLNFG